MLQKLNNGFKIMLGLDIFLICMGIGNFFYKQPLILLSVLGFFNLFIILKKRNIFIEGYNAYKCAEEKDSIIPDKFVKFLYYGKKHLYNVNVPTCV